MVREAAGGSGTEGWEVSGSVGQASRGREVAAREPKLEVRKWRRFMVVRGKY